MNKLNYLLISLVALVAVSCVTDKLDNGAANAEDMAIAAKMINTSVEAEKGRLILVMNEEGATAFSAAPAATRSGLSAFDMIATELGVTDISPVFNMKVNAKLKRELGMDRYYVVRFPEDVDLDYAARSFATLNEVQGVEFSGRVVAPRCQAIGVSEAQLAATRAAAAGEEYPFNDPMLPLQWHYNNTGSVNFPNALAGADINAYAAWKYTAGNSQVIVGIVDEGVCYEHEDLADNMLANEAELNGVPGVDDDGNGFTDDIYGYNFLRKGPVSWDRQGDSGHGTHVAGTVAAVNNNGKGVSGVAGGTGKGDGVKLISCQIMSGTDTASYEDDAAAIEYAADRGASILQNSWGFPVYGESGALSLAYDSQFQNGLTSAIYKALLYFMTHNEENPRCPALKGGIVIFAAGNDGVDRAGYPAAYRDYIAVTGIAPDGMPAYYTCYGPGCNIAAPGGEYHPTTMAEEGCVLSTIPTDMKGNKYGYMQGTSMACPHVSGIAALMLSYAVENGLEFTVNEFKAMLLSSVNDINSRLTGFRTAPYNKTLNLANYYNKMGTGVVDAFQALMIMRGITAIPAPVGEDAVIELGKYIGDGNLTITAYQSVSISEEDRAKLGVTSLNIMGGKLLVNCSKPGSAIIKVKFIAGGSTPGGDMLTGGMVAEREFALIARPDIKVNDALNPEAGGWM